MQSRPSADEDPGARLAQRVRDLRRARHWSLEKLALASGVSRSMLSQIERREANPTLGVASAIARAFGMTLGELVDESEPAARLEVVTANDSSALLRDENGVSIRALTPLRYEGDLELYQVCLEPGGALRSGAHVIGTREVVAVQSGAIRVEAGGREAQLEVGDTVSYRADVAHAITNIGSGVAVLTLVDAYD